MTMIKQLTKKNKSAQVAARISEDDYKLLRAHNINISLAIREALNTICSELRTKVKPPKSRSLTK